jgi:hypothetical protein
VNIDAFVLKTLTSDANFKAKNRAERWVLTDHPAGKPVGERLQREFQREAPRRTTKPWDLLLIERGTDTDRIVEEGVQHDPASQLAWIPATSARDNHASASAGGKSEIISGNAIGGRSVRDGR